MKRSKKKFVLAGLLEQFGQYYVRTPRGMMLRTINRRWAYIDDANFKIIVDEDIPDNIVLMHSSIANSKTRTVVIKGFEL